MNGGLVFRTNNTTDNYLRTCSSPSAIRGWLNVADGATNVTNNNQLTNGANYTTATGHNHDSRYYTETEMTNRTVSPKHNVVEAKEVILTDSSGVAKYKIKYNSTDDSLETIRL